MKFSTTFTVTVLYLCFAVAIVSCKQKNNQQAADLFYYPAKNVYYDSLQSMFYYSLNAGKSWDSITATQPVATGVLGNRVPIERTAENVWALNEADRKNYNGKLIDIVNANTLSLAKADSTRKVKVVTLAKPKEEPAVVVPEEAPKKGLKKFFNKLFGKKKKPAGE